MEETKQEPIPALFEQCLEVYEAMSNDAEYQMVNDEQVLVYEGFLTRLITQDLHYSNPYYTKITGRLKGMDCIRQLKRGGSTSPSKWALVQTPTVELFDEARLKVSKRTGVGKGSRMDQIEQQIRDLNLRLTNAGL